MQLTKDEQDFLRTFAEIAQKVLGVIIRSGPRGMIRLRLYSGSTSCR
jgi:hypothetical protein